MTFSRRAASEMTRRVERIAHKVIGERAGLMTDALAWAGTFHGIGARLLREYADQIGLDPNFTIHDREDSADLMNAVDDQVRDAVRQGVGLAGPRAGDHEERPPRRAVLLTDPVLDGPPLLRI